MSLNTAIMRQNRNVIQIINLVKCMVFYEITCNFELNPVENHIFYLNFIIMCILFVM
jgi:hypothetical protein